MRARWIRLLGIGAAMLVTTVFPLSAQAAGSVETGKELYNTYCVICHGPNMVNSGARAFDLRKFPLGARARFVKSVKDGKKGQNEMPAWGDILTAEEISHLWAYTKTRGKM
mgnify:FL=1